MQKQQSPEKTPLNAAQNQPLPKQTPPQQKIEEIGGAKGPEPTRYGDWEKNGRCTDF